MLFYTSVVVTSVASVTLTRRGMYGTVQVRVQKGLPPGQQLTGINIGEITPDTSVVTLPQGQASKTVSFQVCREGAWCYLVQLSNMDF